MRRGPLPPLLASPRWLPANSPRAAATLCRTPLQNTRYADATQPAVSYLRPRRGNFLLGLPEAA
jgi:hypothetical protein